jgi:hypothetical protein
VRAHGHLTKLQAGHSFGNDTTWEYGKSLKENLPLRLEEAEKLALDLSYMLQVAPRFPEHKKLRWRRK